MSCDHLFSDKVMMSPSILSADFLNLESNVELIAEQADCIHVDVMDGHFVPNLTIGPAIVKSLKKKFATPLDVHLMIDNPEACIDWYLDAGADIATVQMEALTHTHRLVHHIKSRGALAGIALNPGTPVWTLRDLIEDLDLVLIMSVNPGFGGQSFIESSLRKLAELRDLCANFNCKPIVEVDGGIGLSTAPQVVSQGARLLVAGSAVFNTPDPRASMEAIRSAGASAIA